MSRYIQDNFPIIAYSSSLEVWGFRRIWREQNDSRYYWRLLGFDYSWNVACLALCKLKLMKSKLK
jgi:hypothetical protein